MSNFKKALFLKTKNIGDSIILSSAIASLPEEFVCVDILCLPESESIFRMIPRVRNIFVAPRNQRGVNKMRAYLSLYKKIFLQRYDFIAHFSSDWRGAIIAKFSRCGLTVGKKNIKRGKFWHNSFDFIANVEVERRPAAEQDVDLLRRAGLYKKPSAPEYYLDVPDPNKKYILNWLKEKGVNFNQKTIVIHASARWKFKQISLLTWVDLINELKKRKFNVVLSGDKNDEFYNLQISKLCNAKPIISENFSLADSAALIDFSDLLISIDSMAIHMASALKIPVVAIFGPTNEKIWGPWKTKYELVRLSNKESISFSCRPCGLDGCGGSKVSYCLTEITALNILDKINILIKLDS